MTWNLVLAWKRETLRNVLAWKLETLRNVLTWIFLKSLYFSVEFCFSLQFAVVWIHYDSLPIQVHLKSVNSCLIIPLTQISQSSIQSMIHCLGIVVDHTVIDLFSKCYGSFSHVIDGSIKVMLTLKCIWNSNLILLKRRWRIVCWIFNDRYSNLIFLYLKFFWNLLSVAKVLELLLIG